MTRLRSRLAGLLASLVIVALLAGLPVLLLATAHVGTPLVWRDLPNLLLRPDDGSLFLWFLRAVGWVTWGVFVVLLGQEIVGYLRGRLPAHLPGLRLPQSALRHLVATAALLFIAIPTGVSLTSAPPAAAAPVATAQPHPADHAQRPESSSLPEAQALAPLLPAHAPAKRTTVQHTVRRGETLWSIAAANLGSGRRYREIVELNRPLLGDHPDFLRPGWILDLPAHQPEHPTDDERSRGYESHTVEPGDTLTGLALEHLGSADDWPSIYRASRTLTQKDGRHLNDPNLIVTGWTLHIPTDDTSQTTHPAATNRHHQAPDHPTPDHTIPSPEPTTPAPTTGPSTAPASPVPSVATSDGSTAPAGSGSGEAPTEFGAGDYEGSSAPWLLAGLAGAGAILAGSLWRLLRLRRAAQFRARRPGRTIAPSTPAVAPVEKTLMTVGAATLPTVELVDRVLKRLAANRHATGQTMPALAALQLTDDDLTLHLSEGCPLTAPWIQAPDPFHWRIARDANLDEVGPERADAPAPYPQLVTIGTDDRDATWLLNPEQLGTLAVTGDPTNVTDFVRYLAGELAVNPWSRDVTVDCIRVATDAVPLNPTRLRAHDTPDEALHLAVVDAAALVERADDEEITDLPTARAHETGPELWLSRLLLLDVADAPADLDRLRELVRHQPGRTGTALLTVGDPVGTSDPVIHLTGDGRLQFPAVGLDLVPVGLTTDEATGCAALLAQADTTSDVPIPAADPTDAGGRRSHADQAGALLADNTLPRDTPAEQLTEPADTLLPEPDQHYLDTTANTAEDLQALAPLVPTRVRHKVERADPTLDDDVAAWFDPNCALPRLWVLGPVKARVGSTGNPVDVAARKPFYTELLAYLTIARPNGATVDDITNAFGITPGRVRKDMGILRSWLGTNPRTGQDHLPPANRAGSRPTGEAPRYRVEDVLVDADLFRRLRARGQARGPAGLTDLHTALSLVTGTPFQKMRRGGDTWLVDGERHDHYLHCAIVDVAHTLTTANLVGGDLQGAREAAELARRVAPDEEIPRLDLAAVAAAEGRPDLAQEMLKNEISDRTDDGEAPEQLPARTESIIETVDWLQDHRQAS